MAIAYASYRVAEMAKDQVPFVDAINNESPFLRLSLVSPSNAGEQHYYGKIIGFNSMTDRKFGGGYTEIITSREKTKMDLENKSGEMTTHLDMLDKLTPEQLAQQLKEDEMAAAADLGNKIEVDFFDQMIQFAESNHGKSLGKESIGVRVKDMGGTGDKLSHVVLINQKPNHAQLLYNAKMGGVPVSGEKGDIVFRKRTVGSQADPVQIGTDSGSKKQYGFIQLYDMQMGMLLNDPFSVYIIANIDALDDTTHPTASVYEEALIAIKADEKMGRAMIVQHPSISAITTNTYKTDVVEMMMEDKVFDTRVNVFNDAIIVNSRNMYYNNGSQIVVPVLS